MTHSAHRQGTYAGLADDFVVIGFPSQTFTDLPVRLQKFNEIGRRYNPVNIPGPTSHMSPRHLVFDSQDKLRDFLKDYSRNNLALSIVVSGLRDRVAECCEEAGTAPHTLCQSLGIWGNSRALPQPQILEITTMCGHSRIAPDLVWQFADQVKRGTIGAGDASWKMSGLCLCNIFNRVRSARLLQKLADDIKSGEIRLPERKLQDSVQDKDFGITIDQAKCRQCRDCIPYCPVSAIVETTDGLVKIDPAKCYECGVCRQSAVCPVDAISGGDLAWPKNLRGKFQCSYGPYHHAAELLAKEPVKYSDEVKTFVKHELPSELSNDVENLLKPGETVVIAELGRPTIGTTFRDMQKVVQTMLPYGLNLYRQYAVLDERRPITDLMTDAGKGIFRADILDEKIGWAMLKVLVADKAVEELLNSLKKAAGEIDSVFAVDALACVTADTVTAVDRLADKAGMEPACNCKTNVGLGREL